MNPKRYPGRDITVTYDLQRCIHSEECARGLPAVFDPTRRPWVDPDAAAPEAVAEVIERCPSGALHYAFNEPDRTEVDPSKSIAATEVLREPRQRNRSVVAVHQATNLSVMRPINRLDS